MYLVGLQQVSNIVGSLEMFSKVGSRLKRARDKIIPVHGE